MNYIKIDPSCLTSKQNLDILISNLTNYTNTTIYITTTENIINNIHTIFQGGAMQHSHSYTMLRSVVLDYRNIFCEIENINAKIETFYHDIETLVKFVEISGEFTQNLTNIALEKFCRFCFGLFQEYTKNRFNVVQYYTKTGNAEINFAQNSKLILLKNNKHIYNIEKKYIKNPKIVKSLSFKDLMESPSINFKGLTHKEISAMQNNNCTMEITEIETGEIETIIAVNSRTEEDIKFASAKENIAVITISYSGGKPLEVLYEIAKYASNNGTEIFFTSQPATDSSISFGIENENAKIITDYLETRFVIEKNNNILTYSCLKNQTLICVVGNGMAGKTGTAGRLFSHLGKEKINISTISQNALEANISFTIDGKNTQKVMNEINKICFHKRKHVSLLLFGYGNISKGLVKILEKQQSYFEKNQISVSINLIANSKNFIIDENSQNTSLCEKFEQNKISYSNLDTIQNAIESRDILNPILVDLTSSEELAKSYPWFIERKIHIVSASKKANSLPFEEYKNIHEMCKKFGVHFLYEANVGAGLPVLTTIQDMLHSGDKLVKCEGVFSGTLSYIFNNYDGTVPFSRVVKQAKEQGFTEPDPRDDLCGADAARKLLIIARIFGYTINYENIKVESLVPQELEGGKYDETFFDKYAKYDAKMKAMFTEARQNGNVLRYACVLENGKAFAKVVSVPTNSPLGSIKETDNIIAFTTQYYAKTPIVIQGAGAGIDVTSMGVLGDIIKIFKYTQL